MSDAQYILDELWHYLVGLKSTFGVQAASAVYCFARDRGIVVGPTCDTEELSGTPLIGVPCGSQDESPAPHDPDPYFEGQFLYNPDTAHLLDRLGDCETTMQSQNATIGRLQEEIKRLSGATRLAFADMTPSDMCAEIVRLQAENKRLTDSVWVMGERMAEAQATIARLRAEHEKLVELYSFSQDRCEKIGARLTETQNEIAKQTAELEAVILRLVTQLRRKGEVQCDPQENLSTD